jgi:hypothetical protein
MLLFASTPAGLRHYIADMIEHLRFVPPRVEFDPRLANELARLDAGVTSVGGEMYPIIDRRSPFNGYVRMLTPEGGILIFYKDQYRSLLLTILRVSAWIAATWIGGWLIFCESSLMNPLIFRWCHKRRQTWGFRVA